MDDVFSIVSFYFRKMNDKLIIAGKEFSSRLLLGTGKFSSNSVMEQAITASGTEMVTLAMKRVSLGNAEDDMLAHVAKPHIQLLPNTPLYICLVFLYQYLRD